MTCQLYRHFDGNGRLLYVGQSIDALKRLKEHKSKSIWFLSIARVEIKLFPSKNDAFEAEQRAILDENPIFNVCRRHPKKEKIVKFNPLKTMEQEIKDFATQQREVSDTGKTQMDIDQIIEDLGGTGAVAALCGLKPAAVSQWRNRGIPDSWLAFLKATKPQVFRKKAKKSLATSKTLA